MKKTLKDILPPYKYVTLRVENVEESKRRVVETVKPTDEFDNKEILEISTSFLIGVCRDVVRAHTDGPDKVCACGIDEKAKLILTALLSVMEKHGREHKI